MARRVTEQAGTVVNTVTSMKNYLSDAEYKRDLERAKQILSEEPLEKVSIPKQMATVLGSVVPVGINGVYVKIPVDGEVHEVPRPFAEVLRQSLKVVQAQDVREEVMEQLDLKGAPE